MLEMLLGKLLAFGRVHGAKEQLQGPVAGVGRSAFPTHGQLSFQKWLHQNSYTQSLSPEPRGTGLALSLPSPKVFLNSRVPAAIPMCHPLKALLEFLMATPALCKVNPIIDPDSDTEPHAPGRTPGIVTGK